MQLLAKFRLFTVPYISVRSQMLIVDFDGMPSWYLDSSETEESTKCPWEGVVEGTGSGKNRETVTASLFLVFKGCGRFLTPPLIISSPGQKNYQIMET